MTKISDTKITAIEEYLIAPQPKLPLPKIWHFYFPISNNGGYLIIRHSNGLMVNESPRNIVLFSN